MRIAACLLLAASMGSTCLAQPERASAPDPPVPMGQTASPGSPSLPSAPVETDLPALMINLPTALQLAGSRPIDVQLAQERVRRAAAALDLAWAQWLPSITLGADYNRHDGQIQNSDGSIVGVSRSSFMVGAGSGIGSSAIFSLNEAVFGPLVARQNLRAREANQQVALNDTMLAVTDAYFSVEQARGELAGAIDATRRTRELLRRVEKLAAGLIPTLEVTRASAELARREETELLVRERWQVISADLMRVLRLDPTTQVVPVEPPQLQITVVDLRQSVDDLVAIGLTNRPELASRQADVQATLNLLRQEKLRPLMPSLLLRGWSTPVTGTLGVGYFGGGSNGSIGNFSGRGDVDVQLLWQLDNLGFGNRARTRIRDSEHQAAILELFRTQDQVAADVAQAYAQARQSSRRVEIAQREVMLSIESYQKNLVGLGQTRRAGDLVVTIIRPQEAIASVQVLAQAYANYYLAVADSNRAQFRLYRALGHPAQCINLPGESILNSQPAASAPANSSAPALPAIH